MYNRKLMDSLVDAAGLQIRDCTKWQWQIMDAAGEPLVNVWPTSGKYGMAIELKKQLPRESMEGYTGTEKEAVQYAELLEKTVEKLWSQKR